MGESAVKRQKERARQERQKEKLERRAQRSADRRERSASGVEDPAIAGVTDDSQLKQTDEDVSDPTA